MPSAHATRSASGAKRWMNCPGSIRMEEGRPNSSSPAARLGTAAHALGEACLLDGSAALDWVGGYIRLDHSEQATVFAPGANPIVVPVHATPDGLPPENLDFEDFPIDDNMADAVQVYLNFVRTELEIMGPGTQMMVEKQFNLNWLIGYDFDAQEEALWDLHCPDDTAYRSPNGMWRDAEGNIRTKDGRFSRGPMFGTNDCSLFAMFERVVIVDYKHGQGIPVEVEDNAQEKYYALGIAHDIDWAFDELDLVIVQPRCPHPDGPIRRWTTTAAALREFEEELRQAALATEDPDAPLSAGDHCTFCKAAAVCPQLREQAFVQAGIEFDDDTGELIPARMIGPEDSDEHLKQRMDAIPLLDVFIKTTQAEAKRRLMESDTGEACFGKLVRKKSNRAFRPDLRDPITDEPIDALDALVSLGFPREALYCEPKPKSPAQIEAVRPAELVDALKAQGVKSPVQWIKKAVADVTYKPEGGVTIVPPSDPREAVAPSFEASNDFDEFVDE